MYCHLLYDVYFEGYHKTYCKKITERVETSFCRPFLGAPLLSKTNVTQGPNYNTKFEIRRV